MPTSHIDTIREGVLNEMERTARRFRTALLAGALIESMLMLGGILLTDWKNPTQRLIFITAISTWTLVAIGLMVLGAHITKRLARLAALSAGDG